MNNVIRAVLISFIFNTFSIAGDIEEVKKSIIDGFTYLNKMKKGWNDYSKDGAIEFWSSGGLLHVVDPSGRPETYEEINVTPKHIEVVILVPGKAAVAMYYSEGHMKPKGANGVSHYLTRVSQSFIKEGSEWKTRTSHWSPVVGGSGTSQTGKE